MKFTSCMNGEIWAAFQDSQKKSGRAFSPAERRAVHDGLLAQCDGLDGLEDGVVANVRGCDFDPNRLVCEEQGDDSCISQAQVDALDKAFAPLVNSAGYEIYPAFPVDTGMIEGSMTYIPGKNFFSPGASDTWFSAFDTLGFYQRAAFSLWPRWGGHAEGSGGIEAGLIGHKTSRNQQLPDYMARLFPYKILHEEIFRALFYCFYYYTF